MDLGAEQDERSSRGDRSRSRSRKKSSRRRRSRSRSRHRSRRSRSRSRSKSSKKKKKEKKKTNWDQVPDPSSAGTPLLVHGNPAIPPTASSAVSAVIALQSAQAVAIGAQAQAGDDSGIGLLAPSDASALANLLKSQVAAQNPYTPLAGASGGQPQRMDQIRRTVFVGNITPQMNEDNLRDFFNEKVAQVPDRPTSQYPTPVCSVTIKRDKMYAFAEFFTQADADLCICMDGIEFMGTALKIRRHSDYQPEPKPTGSFILPGFGAPPPDSDTQKLFLGPLPLNLSEEDVKKFVTSFGPLKSFSLVKDLKTGQSKGYAFFSYADPTITEVACQGLNGISLGGKDVVCRKATTTPLSHNTQKTQQLKGGIPIINYDSLCPVPTILDCAMPPPASRILVLQNLVSADELKMEYSDVIEDIKSECKKYGEVLSIIGHVDRVFVEYPAPDGAVMAASALSGRKFNGRIVITTFLAESEWEKKALD